MLLISVHADSARASAGTVMTKFVSHIIFKGPALEEELTHQGLLTLVIDQFGI